MSVEKRQKDIMIPNFVHPARFVLPDVNESSGAVTAGSGRAGGRQGLTGELTHAGEAPFGDGGQAR